MKHLRFSLLALCALTDAASAAAFQLYELGTPIIGTAAVGQAVVDDASISYFNPAGMSLLSGTEVMLGAQTIIPNIKFSTNDSISISGNNGGNAGILTPGMSLFLAYNFSPCVKFGVSVTTPYGGSLMYNDGWAGRYVIQNALFYAINMNPSIAYRVNDWLAIGVGGAIEYMNLHQDTAIPLIDNVDGQINVKVEDYSGGFNAGVMITPCAATRIGVAYRSQITHDLSGNLTFLRVVPTPDVTTKMIMPQNVIVSFAQDFGTCFTLLAEAGWSNWSSMQNTVLNLGPLAAVTPRDWQDTYRVGLGAQYRVCQKLLLQAGVSYDSSPTTPDLRLPDLPMDKQIRAGTGIIYALRKDVKLGISYEYWNLGNADIYAETKPGVLSGSYSRNDSSVVQASINVSL